MPTGLVPIHRLMCEMSPGDAVRILRSAGQIGLWDADGGAVPVTVTDQIGRELIGTAPRFTVSGGQLLSTRLLTSDGDPHTVRLVVEEAAYESPELARVRLAIESVELDPRHRRAPRLRSGGTAWLTALNCQEVVDGDRVDGTIVDVSASGVAFSSNRVLRRGDCLEFHGRFFSETVDGEVRVASLRQAAVPDRTIYGCEFIAMDDETREQVDRIVSGERRTSVDLSAIQALVQAHRSADAARETGRRRRFLRG
ncbi:MAG: PilZ domain [Gaiellales bacterium]|nr:PilZ domain [Gaiellales bacterium]